MGSWEWRYGSFIQIEWTWIMYLFRYSHQAWCFWRYRFRLQKASKMTFHYERILTSQFVLCFWKCWLIHSSSWWTDPEKEPAYEMWILAGNIPLFTHKNGKESWPKNGILPNFIQSPNIKYSTYTKTVWGELKGHFELHLALIWGSEDRKLKNPPPF